MARPAYKNVRWTQGDLIRKARTMAGLSPKELGDRIGVSSKTLSLWENDHRQPRTAQLVEIARATGCEWLVGDVIQLISVCGTDGNPGIVLVAETQPRLPGILPPAERQPPLSAVS